MTLGLKLNGSIVLPPKCYFRFVNQYLLAGSASLFAFCNLAVSKADLKHSGTFLRKIACDLGFAAYEIVGKMLLNTSAVGAGVLGTGAFTDVFTDVFTGVFTDVFTDVFSDVVTEAFTGAFADVFIGVFTDVYTGVFSHAFSNI